MPRFSFLPLSNTEQLHAQRFVTLLLFAMLEAVAGREVVVAACGVVTSTPLLDRESIVISIGMQVFLFGGGPSSLLSPSSRFSVI